MERKELVKSGLFYTYGHYLNGNLIYIGEGKGHRAWHFWDKSYRDQRDQVQVRIFEIFDDKNLAVSHESLLIHKERINCNEYLLNKADYGCGTRGCQHSDESKKKISGSLIGKQHSEESKQKMSAAKIGEKCYNFKGLSIGTNKNNQIIVFSGAKDMKARRFNSGHISSVILGNRASHKGFTFSRSDDPIYLQQILDEDNFVDDVSKERIKEFLQG